MMAPRVNVTGSIFTQANPTLQQTVDELMTELRQTQARLVDEQRRRAEAEAALSTFRRQDRLRAEPYPPAGNRRDGYTCFCCGTAIDYPFEANFCSYCGKPFDWGGYMPNSIEDVDAYDRRNDR